MVHWTQELSKYILIVLFLLYTFTCFFGFTKNQNKRVNGTIYTIQRVIMFLFHFDAYWVLYLTTKETDILVFYAIQVIAFAGILLLYKLCFQRVCDLLLNNMILLLMVGMIVLTRLSMERAIRQFVFMIGGMTFALLIPVILKCKSAFRNLTWLYAAVGIIALGLVSVAGTTSYGAKLSISIAGISVQPSEFVKIIFVFFIASMIYRKKDLKQLMITAVVSAIFVLILVASRDLGGAFLYYFTFLVLIFAATGKWYYFAGGIGFLGGAAVVGNQLFSHVQARVAAWRDPLSVIDSAGYQVSQSLFGIGTGGWFGLGLGQGVPGKIPVVEKDFIFSAIAEELGGIFALCLICVCLSCFIMIVNVSIRMKDGFYKLVSLGLGTLYIIQIFLTVGGAIKFIPSTGVTLPLVSYGGSSLVATLIVFGVVQGLYICPDKQDNEEVSSNYSTKAVMAVTYLFLALYVAMMIYFGWFLQFERDVFLNNPYNKVQDVLADHIVRGEIRASDGTVLAYTKVDSDNNETRVYPYGREFAHVVGYSTYGRTGLESQANYSLLTSHASFFERAQNSFREEKNIGDNVITTLDFDLQRTAYDALGKYDGAVIVMEPETGKILAMVSKPSYDPNTIADNWEEISTGEESVLVNRATQGQYAPGSTFKIFTTLAYYREHPQDYGTYSYDCDGSFTYEDNTINCSKKTHHGREDLMASFANSCNSSYAKIGTDLDISIWNEVCDQMLFNRDLPIVFESNSSKFHLDSDASSWIRMQTAIGQGDTLVSPLHMLMVVSAIDNDGVLMRPYLIDETQNYEGVQVTSYEPYTYGELCTSEEAAFLQKYMRAVVTDGTATKLNVSAYDAYGKTGTAQVSNTTDQTNAWFVGFARKEGQNDIAITVIVEDSGTGSSYAVPIAKKIFDAYYH